MKNPTLRFWTPGRRKSRWGFFVDDPPPESDEWYVDDTCPSCGKKYVESVARLYEHPHCVNDTFLFECPKCDAAWTLR